MAKFKVGDKVKVRAESPYMRGVFGGEVGKIYEVNDRGEYSIDFGWDQRIGFVDSDLVAAKNSVASTNSKFKVGDKVAYGDTVFTPGAEDLIVTNPDKNGKVEVRYEKNDYGQRMLIEPNLLIRITNSRPVSRNSVPRSVLREGAKVNWLDDEHHCKETSWTIVSVDSDTVDVIKSGKVKTISIDSIVDPRMEKFNGGIPNSRNSIVRKALNSVACNSLNARAVCNAPHFSGNLNGLAEKIVRAYTAWEKAGSFKGDDTFDKLNTLMRTASSLGGSVWLMKDGSIAITDERPRGAERFTDFINRVARNASNSVSNATVWKEGRDSWYGKPYKIVREDDGTYSVYTDGKLTESHISEKDAKETYATFTRVYP